MTPAAVAEQLQAVFGAIPSLLAQGVPCAMRVGEDEVLELRYVADPPALCAALPLGSLDRNDPITPVLKLLRTDLSLSHAGAPHCALAPDHQQVYLCWTLLLEQADASVLGDRLQRLVTVTPQMRAALVSEHVLQA